MVRNRIVNCVSEGEPPEINILKDVDTIRFVIYNFQDIAHDKVNAYYIQSPIVKAHGYEWMVCVAPGKYTAAAVDDSGYLVDAHRRIHCLLSLQGYEDDVTATYAYSCKGLKRKPEPRNIHRFHPNDRSVDHNFLSRDDAIENYLEDDGSLIIECDIQIAAEHKRVWYPKELQQQPVLVELYQDAANSESSDVAFSVGATVFRAHKSILSVQSKILYKIANQSSTSSSSQNYYNDDDRLSIPIDSVPVDIFKGMLDFIYTVKTPDIEDKDIAKEYLSAADRFDCVHLKLYVESVIVDKFLTAKKAVPWLVYADSCSCALLKEAATNLFLTDPESVKQSEDWHLIKESPDLLEELLFACSNKLLGVMNGTSDEMDELDVTALREELSEANLPLDGSRKVLIDRWNAYRERELEDPDARKVVRFSSIDNGMPPTANDNDAL